VTTWIVLRAAGVGAYLMLFASVALGLTATTAPFGKRFARASTTSLHAFASSVGLFLLAIHLGGLLIDRFTPFTPAEILVPGASTYRTVPVAFGIFAAYAVALLVVSSWLRRRYPTSIWRTLHLAAAPAFALGLLHGLTAGSDASRPWMVGMYVVTAAIVVFLLVLRGMATGITPARRAQSSPSPSGSVSREGPGVAVPSSP
jgi:methionine sulfoxide reductase heme-binding subunit